MDDLMMRFTELSQTVPSFALAVVIVAILQPSVALIVLAIAVETEHHLVVAHAVTSVGHDRTQLAARSRQARSAVELDDLGVLADRGYFSGEEILACERAGITVTLPKPLTSGRRWMGATASRTLSTRPRRTSTAAPRASDCPSATRTWRAG